MRINEITSGFRLVEVTLGPFKWFRGFECTTCAALTMRPEVHSDWHLNLRVVK